MNLGISGRSALVLGASRGLGQAIAIALANEGVRVAITSRDAGSLADSAAHIKKVTGAEVKAIPANIGRLDEMENLVATLDDCMGGVDILVNNTGGPPRGLITEISADAWRQHFETMVLGVISLSNSCLPHMFRTGWGRVITVCSSGVVQPIPMLGISNTLRSSLIAWSKTLANEVAAKGVTVNCVLPGRIHTDRVDELDAAVAAQRGISIEAVRQASREGIPMGRYGTVEEFSAMVAFLAGVPAGYVTGSAIRVDGGLIRSM